MENPITEAMESENLSFRKLAKRIGVSHGYLWKVFHGKQKEAYKLAYAFENAGIMKGREFISKYETWLSERSA